MQIQNTNINISLPGLLNGGSAPRGGSTQININGPIDNININLRGPADLQSRVRRCLPEIDKGPGREMCCRKARFGKGGPLRHLMRKLSRLLGGQQGGCGPKRPRGLNQTPLAPLHGRPNQGCGPKPSSFGGPQNCRGAGAAQREKMQMLRMMLDMLLDMSQCLDQGVPGMKQCQNSGAIPRPSLPCSGPAPGPRSGAPSSGTATRPRPAAPCPRPSRSCSDSAPEPKMVSRPRPRRRPESTATITGGRGDDTIKVKGAKHTRIHGGPGDDKIKFKPSKNSKKAVIKGGRGDDTIKVKGAKHTRIYGGPGDDTIIFDPTKKGRKAKIDGGAGCDTAIIRGDSPISLSNSKGDVYYRRGEGGPNLSTNGLEQIRLKGKDSETTLYPNNF